MKQYRTWICLALVLATFLPFVMPVKAAAEDWGTITGSYVNIREAPKGKVIKTLNKNTVVQVLGFDGSWYKIQVDGLTAYVYKDYLKTGAEAPASQDDPSDPVPTPVPPKEMSDTTIPRPSGTLLKLGSTGEDVKRLQARLKEVNYYSGEVSGTFDAATENAVREYQKHNRLGVDGKVGPKTIASLWKAKQGTGTGDATVTAVQKPTVQYLRFGNAGENVRRLQMRLQELGYLMDNTVTGNYSAATRTAVQQYQRDKGLQADGVAGPQTITSLWNNTQYVPAPTPSTTPAETASPDSTPAPSETVTPAPSATATPVPVPEVFDTNLYLRKGQTNDNVKKLQQALKHLGYFSSSTAVTNYFGTATYNAVLAFQRANHLGADGVAGPKTLAALNQALAGSSPVQPDDPTSTEDPSSGETVSYTFAYKSFDVTLKLGSTGVHVKDMQYALYLKGFYKGGITGTFDSTTKTALLAFQRAVGLTADGLAGEYTLCTLYTLLDPLPADAVDTFRFDKGEDIACELIDWDTANSALPRQAVLTIVDVDTGYSFQVKRTGGGKHADVEPLEAYDTNVMFHVYGMRWSWTRRAIWVIYNGHKYAASMNGQPHGYDTIGGNDMTGQICLHFVNSRTHGSNKIDPDHQAAVQRAYQASVLKVESALAK